MPASDWSHRVDTIEGHPWTVKTIAEEEMPMAKRNTSVYAQLHTSPDAYIPPQRRGGESPCEDANTIEDGFDEARLAAIVQDKRLVTDKLYKMATERVKEWLTDNAALINHRVTLCEKYGISTSDLVRTAKAIVASNSPKIKITATIVHLTGIAMGGRQEACDERGIRSDKGHEHYLKQLRIVFGIFQAACSTPVVVPHAELDMQQQKAQYPLLTILTESTDESRPATDPRPKRQARTRPMSVMFTTSVKDMKRFWESVPEAEVC